MNLISRRSFIQSAAAAMAAPSAFSSPRKPNIIVILADDLGYGDLGCYGNTEIRTPHLDSLAKGGLRFTDFHSSCPVCSPTRAGLLTGRYQQRCRVPSVVTVAKHRDRGLPPSEITFAERLRETGYATGIFGKWHLGYQQQFNPTRQGFDRFRGYVSGNVDYISHIDQGGVADWWENDRLAPEEGYSTHLITQHSVQFIEDNHDQPFCLYVAHESPHYPYQAPDDKADRTVGGEFNSHGSRQDKKSAYKTMIEEMDKGVGEILAALKKHNLEQDTFVFFFSDNGATKVGSNSDLRAWKGTLWEGGHRVPAMAYWPGRIQPGVIDDTAISLDIFPTLLSLGGADIPTDRPIDGRDLSSILFNRESLPARKLFWSYNNQRAVRDGDWKLVITKKSNKDDIELFNLKTDPSEANNLASQKTSILQKLLRDLTEWEKDVKLEELTW